MHNTNVNKSRVNSYFEKILSKKPLEKYLYEVPQKNESTIPVWFCFPYTYMYGMSTLGFLSLFKELDMNPDVDAQKVFADTDYNELKVQRPDIFGISMLLKMTFWQFLSF